jgi:selenide,water dikinase
MTTLNADAAARLHEHQATAVTDVTGFGLLGHLREMCLASGVGARVTLASVPVLDGALDLLARGMWAGGSQRNLEATVPMVRSDHTIESLKPLFDAQTSGGLLVAVPPGEAPGFAGSTGGAVIGVLVDADGIEVV